MATYAEVNTLVQALLNDVDKTWATDAVLVPHIKSAVRHFQAAVAQSGVSILNKIVDNISVTAVSQKTLTRANIGADMIVPLRLWEKPTGGTEKFLPMTQAVGGLPDVEQSAYLRIWEWRNDAVQIVGATRGMTVKVLYEKKLADYDGVGTTVIPVEDVVDILSYRAAATMARSRGVRQLAADLDGEYLTLRNTWIDRNLRPQQRRTYRRRPYGLRRHYSRSWPYSY